MEKPCVKPIPGAPAMYGGVFQPHRTRRAASHIHTHTHDTPYARPWRDYRFLALSLSLSFSRNLPAWFFLFFSELDSECGTRAESSADETSPAPGTKHRWRLRATRRDAVGRGSTWWRIVCNVLHGVTKPAYLRHLPRGGEVYRRRQIVQSMA